MTEIDDLFEKYKKNNPGATKEDFFKRRKAFFDSQNAKGSPKMRSTVSGVFTSADDPKFFGDDARDTFKEHFIT